MILVWITITRLLIYSFEKHLGATTNYSLSRPRYKHQYVSGDSVIDYYVCHKSLRFVHKTNKIIFLFVSSYIMKDATCIIYVITKKNCLLLYLKNFQNNISWDELLLFT